MDKLYGIELWLGLLFQIIDMSLIHELLVINSKYNKFQLTYSHIWNHHDQAVTLLKQKTCLGTNPYTDQIHSLPLYTLAPHEREYHAMRYSPELFTEVEVPCPQPVPPHLFQRSTPNGEMGGVRCEAWDARREMRGVRWEACVLFIEINITFYRINTRSVSSS